MTEEVENVEEEAVEEVAEPQMWYRKATDKDAAIHVVKNCGNTGIDMVCELAPKAPKGFTSLDKVK